MKNHFYLSLALLVASPAVAWAADSTEKPAVKKETPAAGKPYKDVTVAEFDRLRQAGTNHVVLDVRTKEEFEEGHIPGAVLLDFNSPDFASQLARLDKKKTYLVHCAVGGRSARASKKMAEMNFEKVYNLPGGMTAWEKAGKPVEK